MFTRVSSAHIKKYAFDLLTKPVNDTRRVIRPLKHNQILCTHTHTHNSNVHIGFISTLNKNKKVWFTKIIITQPQSNHVRTFRLFIICGRYVI